MRKEGFPTFILCYVNNGINTRPDVKADFLSYDSLENCLKIVNVLYKGKHLASTLLGSSKFDGNGDKEKIRNIITTSLTDVDLTIYDYEQKVGTKCGKNNMKKKWQSKDR